MTSLTSKLQNRAVRAWRAGVEKLGPRGFQLLFNLYPPYFGAGVRVTFIAKDMRRIEVEMPLTPLNQNYFGTQFGGSLYSMCDPFLLLMLMKALGPDYIVWDKAASIEFLSPGRGTVRATFVLLESKVEEIRSGLETSRKLEPDFTVDVMAEDGSTVARVHKTLYVRRKLRAA